MMVLHISGKEESILQAIDFLKQAVHHVEIKQDSEVMMS